MDESIKSDEQQTIPTPAAVPVPAPGLALAAAPHLPPPPPPPPPPPVQSTPTPAPPASHSQSHQSSPGKCLYGKELRCMMYGFGDDKNPFTESVELLEELVLKYITETTKKTISIRGTGKITVDDIMYLIRKDKRKCSRVRELLLMNEELKRSRKAFDLESLATHKHL